MRASPTFISVSSSPTNPPKKKKKKKSNPSKEELKRRAYPNAQGKFKVQSWKTTFVMLNS